MEGQYEIRARGEAYTLSRRFPSAAPQRDREELPPAAAAILIRSCAADSSALPQLRRALAGIESRQDLASLGNSAVVERLVSLIEAGRLGLSRGRRGTGEAPMEIPLPVLRLGSQGADVRKLQVLLNARMRPSPNMKTDGVFGIVTDKALRNFQKSRLIAVDGIVGRGTWRHLLAPETGTPVVPVPKGPAHGAPAAPPGRASAAGAAPATTDARSPVPPTQAVPGSPAPPSTPAAQPAPESIIEWPLERKLKEVLSRVPARLPGELRTQFLQMVSFEALAVGLATIAVALLFPAAGQVLLVGMLLLLGKEVVTELGEGLRETVFASTPQELDAAAEHLARAFAMAGIAVLLAAIARFAKRPATKAPAAEPAPAASGSLREPTRVAGRRTSQTEPVAERPPAPEGAAASPRRPPAGATSGALVDNPAALVRTRTAELNAAIPENSRGRITMAVGVAEDGAGTRTVLIATSEPRGYLRPGVTINPGEVVVRGTGHAEADLVQYATDNNLRLVEIGATRPVCGACQEMIAPTGANIATPLKVPK